MNSTIRDKRKQLRLSQYKVAKLSQVGRYRISLIECGYVAPTPEEQARLDAILDLQLRTPKERQSRKIPGQGDPR